MIAAVGPLAAEPIPYPDYLALDAYATRRRRAAA